MFKMDTQLISTEGDDSLEEGEIPSPGRPKKQTDLNSEYYETISELSEEDAPPRRRPVCRRRAHRRRRSRTRARTRPRTTVRDRRMNDFDEMRKRYLERLRANRRREEDQRAAEEERRRTESFVEMPASDIQDTEMEIMEQPPPPARQLPVYDVSSQESEPVYDVSSQESEPQPSAGSSQECAIVAVDSEEEVDLHQLRALALNSQRNRVKTPEIDIDSDSGSSSNEFSLRAEALRTAILKKRPTILQKKETRNKRRDKLKESIENKKNVQANRNKPNAEPKKQIVIDEGVGKENKKDAVNDAVEDENVLREQLLATMARKEHKQKDTPETDRPIEILTSDFENNGLPPTVEIPETPDRLSQTISDMIDVFGDSESPVILKDCTPPVLVYTPSAENAPSIVVESNLQENSRTVVLSNPVPKPVVRLVDIKKLRDVHSIDMFSDSFNFSEKAQKQDEPVSKIPTPQPHHKDTAVAQKTPTSPVSKPSVSSNSPSRSQSSKWKPRNQVIRNKPPTSRTKNYPSPSSKRKFTATLKPKEPMKSPEVTVTKKSLKKTISNSSAMKKTLPVVENGPQNKIPKSGASYQPLRVMKAQSSLVEKRFVIHIGPDSSDDDDDFDDLSQKPAHPPPDPSKLIDKLDDFLLAARRNVEANIEADIPPTPEAVRSHLPPSQQLEYKRLKQKLAEKENTSSKLEDHKQTDSPASPVRKEIPADCQNPASSSHSSNPEDLRYRLALKRKLSEEVASHKSGITKPDNKDRQDPAPKTTKISLNTQPVSSLPKPSTSNVPTMTNQTPKNVPVKSRQKLVKNATKESLELAKIGQLMSMLKRELAAETVARDTLARLRQEIIVIEQKKQEHSNRSTMLRAKIRKLLGPSTEVPKPVEVATSSAPGSLRKPFAVPTATSTSPSKKNSLVGWVSSCTPSFPSTSRAATPVTNFVVPTVGCSSPSKSATSHSTSAQGPTEKVSPGVTANTMKSVATGSLSPVLRPSPSKVPSVTLPEESYQKRETAVALCNSTTTDSKKSSSYPSAATVGGSPSHASEAPKPVDHLVSSANDITSCPAGTSRPKILDYVSPLVYPRSEMKICGIKRGRVPRRLALP